MEIACIMLPIRTIRQVFVDRTLGIRFQGAARMSQDDPVPPPNPAAPGRFAWVLPFLQYAGVGLAGVAAIALIIAIGVGIFSGGKDFLINLADPLRARGLIAFLIAITTVGIALILTISTVFGSGGIEAEKSFDRGKQVLSTLIGVLGTIVGFYFGSLTSQPVPTLAISPAVISNLQPKKGETFTISSSVAGGKPPYTYSITFDANVIPPAKDVSSPDGTIKKDFTVPAGLTADQDVAFVITAKDSSNNTAEYNKDGKQKISFKIK